MMLTRDDLKTDQKEASDRLYNYDNTLLVAKMGTGKTIVALDALSSLLADGVLKNVLIVAPLKVAKTVWAQEAKKWGHTKCLNIAVCCGSEKQRLAALGMGAQITVINFENLAWLYGKVEKDHFDGLLVDELTKLKAVGGKTFKAIRGKLPYFKWRVGMTGTPVSEDWQGLFGQMMIVDGGEALGTRKDKFLRKYFYPTDYNEYNWAMYDWSADAVSELIGETVYTMQDYRHELPELITEYLDFDMSPDLRATYYALEKDMLVGEGENAIVAATAAVKAGKLMQMAGGFGHNEDGEIVPFCDARIEICKDLVDEMLVGGTVMVCYWYKHDLARLREAMPDAYVLSDDVEKGTELWNAGQLKVILVHPMSCGHGLNLAKGGHQMVWYSPVWSRDVYEQTVARLWRRGQTHAVTVVRMCANEAIDQVVYDKVDGKGVFEDLWEKHLGR